MVFFLILTSYYFCWFNGVNQFFDNYNFPNTNNSFLIDSSKFEAFHSDTSYSLFFYASSFLGCAYKDQVLDFNSDGLNLANICEFDCVTFIELTLAYSLLYNWYNGDTSFLNGIIKSVRYRDGVISNYNSRLHYFSEWILQNEKSGLFNNISFDLGGDLRVKKIYFISQNILKYPKFKTKREIQDLINTEKYLSTCKLPFLPKQKFNEISSCLENGDIIAFTSNVKGLDVGHVGIVVILKDKLHLIHASKLYKRVLISKETISEYLIKNKKFDGIIILRPSYI